MFKSILVFSALSLSTAAFAQENNSTFQKELENFVRTQLKPSCLESIEIARKKIVQIAPSPEFASAMSRLTEPEICTCVSTKMIKSTTPEILKTKERFRAHYLAQYNICSVQHIKANLGDACRTGLGAEYFKKRGLSKEEISAKLPKICSCVQSTAQEISDEEWIRDSFEKYQSYQQGRGAKNANINSKPESILEQCRGNL
jgi:hypothetical protein